MQMGRETQGLAPALVCTACLDFYWAIQGPACPHRVIAFCCGCYKIHWKHMCLEGHIKLLHLSQCAFFPALFYFDLTGQRRRFNKEV